MLRCSILSNGELALKFESDVMNSRLINMLQQFESFGPFLVKNQIVHTSRLRELIYNDPVVQSLSFEEAANVVCWRTFL
jgi:hypothetical protein